MKLEDKYREKLMKWVENEEYLPFQQMQFKLVVQMLEKSEREAWEEVERLKKEIKQRKAINQKAIKVMMSATSDNERLRKKMGRTQSQLEVIRECLEPLISKVDYQTRARLLEIMRYVQNGLQLTKGESGGTGE